MYFEDTFAYIEGNPELREPQIQGYMKVKEYFESSLAERPALVTLPTGVGKTGLLAILPYGIAKERVLIVTPNRTIRTTVTDSLDPRNPNNFWWNRKVIRIPSDLPSVIEYEGNAATLNQAQIVITNIHRLQSHNVSSLLSRVPRNFFDMVIIDEAHHSPANSWVEVEEYFNSAKIVKITGTPFRADRQEIFAKEVYEYPLSRAMVNGYVKQLVKMEHLPDELTFRIAGVEGDVSLEEALKLKEQDLVARSVAYSTDCSKKIVEKSLELMNQKRQATGVPHKIIAVACSIPHAQEICNLYEECGCPVSLIHSEMSLDEQEHEKASFHNDRTKAIVNVGMLGEGYDHPYISVAAIFRPFKSLSAYVQFAGRALRSIPDAKIPDVDNVAHLVYHSALGLDDLWEYYRKEQTKAEIIDMLQKQATQDTSITFNDDRDNFEILPVVESETSRILQDTFVADQGVIEAYEEALASSRNKAIQAAKSLREQGFSVTDELIKILEGTSFNDLVKSKRPDLELKERRSGLKSLIEDNIAEMIADKGLDSKARAGDIAMRLGYIRDGEMPLDGICVKYVNDRLLRIIGYSRKEWSIQDFKRAEPLSMDYIKYLSELI